MSHEMTEWEAVVMGYAHPGSRAERTRGVRGPRRYGVQLDLLRDERDQALRHIKRLEAELAKVEKKQGEIVWAPC